jgi:hypothetical protein
LVWEFRGLSQRIRSFMDSEVDLIEDWSEIGQQEQTL